MARDPKSSYYDAGGIEVMDVIAAKLTDEQFKGYLLGNIIKYSLRANHKGSFSRDAEKIRYYSDELKRETQVQEELARQDIIDLTSQHAQPVLTIPPIDTWNWEALSKHEFTTKAARDQEAFWNSVHPDYKAYGGL
jgi:hypothetical protein